MFCTYGKLNVLTKNQKGEFFDENNDNEMKNEKDPDTDDVINACTNFTNVVIRIMRVDESKGGCNSSKI